ncbi:hypothetical protein [Methylobacterium haplocladii]|uniref:Lipoprotein n=1 Tax=Methylobacterium haplocladii TaxID=1176176 RepID=A0A512IQX1_9HYPH|nr:hypothetical protein [Methylobacterium haplocladii]GEP00124.1 hypothetical protein MHA02_25110 [Methylobacterium haplocladii]GJD85375.1 hypothetical protein HPGCJGGD_3264 [Methylobacterium haplocladii]GLS58172.1 hypothetical protein GCM10007887_08280 [Methylobacterium haplocladii]
MKALLLSGLAVILVTMGAQARPEPRVPGKPHPIMAPVEQAATDCFAETVMANPKATGLARAGRWYDAAGVIGFLCRPEVSRMVQAHDRLYGPGTGDRYFKGAYARHLDKQLEARLQPLLETKSVASAEPPVDATGGVSSGDPSAAADTAQ